MPTSPEIKQLRSEVDSLRKIVMHHIANTKVVAVPVKKKTVDPNWARTYLNKKWGKK